MTKFAPAPASQSAHTPVRPFVLSLALAACMTAFIPLRDCRAEDLAGIDGVVEEMQKDLGKGFLVEKLEPFVVATDDSAQALKSYKATITRAMDAFYLDFFEKKPEKVIRVYLFKDKVSYGKYVEDSTGSPPPTPFGYCGDNGTKLVMNIGTGGGTLIHEMAHAFIRADFPDVPTWFNEGFASLFEQSTYVDKQIKGMANWRLPGLQKALTDKKFVTFEKLIGMTDAEFRGKSSGDHYAEARYLCMFMQEKGLLVKFYKAFKEAHKPPAENVDPATAKKQDKTGFETFKSMFDQPMDKLEAEFQAWVMKLKFRR
jgi:hypothetical protein